MLFKPVSFHEAQEEDQGWLYGFMPVLGSDPVFDLARPTMPATVDGRRRQLVTSVIRMLVLFNQDPARRTKLRQDCGAFALACYTGNHQRGVQFGTHARPAAYVRSVAIIRPRVSAIEPGKGLLTSGTVLENRRAQDKGRPVFHIMIRASADTDEAVEDILWASKLSTGGVVMLHKLNGIDQVYPQTHLERVTRIE